VSRFVSELSVTPMPDGEQWRVNQDFGYVTDVYSASPLLIIVPKDFLTDFASVPKLFQNIYTPWNRYGPAAIVHDWLYTSQTTTRGDADNVLKEAMRVLCVEDRQIEDIYNAVRMFGKNSWDSNTRLKASGYSRMAAPGSTPPYAAAL
jgi:hypothetical protein